MDFYFLQAPRADDGMTRMEKDLADAARSFRDCVFDEATLARLTGFIQVYQDELMRDHPEREAVPVGLFKGCGESLWLVIGQYRALCIKVRQIYAEPRKQNFQSE